MKPAYLYPNLRAEMARKGITIQQMANDKDIGLSSNTLNMKLRGKVRWFEGDMKRIRNKYFPDLTLDYLFESDPSVLQERKESK